MNFNFCADDLILALLRIYHGFPIACGFGNDKLLLTTIFLNSKIGEIKV